MVDKRSKTNDAPQLDEGWWASLLAEEEKYGTSSFDFVDSAESLEEKKGGESRPSAKSAIIDWEQVQRLYEIDEVIDLQVTGFNRGGLLVSGQGVHGFVPVSHLIHANCEELDEERDTLLADYVGRSLGLKVIECDSDRGRVVFSERAALAESGRRNQLFEYIKPGDCVQGEVTNVTDFGVFIDLGGVEGLIHVSELSWGRVRHPSDVSSVGSILSAYVISVDKERSRVALSIKRLSPNPWETAAERYRPGQVVEAEITSIVPFGAFARLEEGLDGLIHVSEMGLSEGDEDVGALVRESQKVQVRVLSVDANRQRLGLSLMLET